MPRILNVHSPDNTENYSFAGVASSGTVSVVVGQYSREGAETSIAWVVGVQEMLCWSRIPVTYIDGKVVMVVVAGTMTALEGRVVVVVVVVGQMAKTIMMKQRMVMSQTTRDRHMDRRVCLALGTSCAVTAVEAAECKSQDDEVDRGEWGSCMMSVGEASLVGSSLSANSLTQMTPRWKVGNEVVVEREAWYRLEERMSSRWTTVVALLLALLASRAQNVSPRRKTSRCEKALYLIP